MAPQEEAECQAEGAAGAKTLYEKEYDTFMPGKLGTCVGPISWG